MAFTVSLALFAPSMFVQVVPPSVETCQCSEGVGEPVPSAVNVAVWPASADWGSGWITKAGGRSTTSSAGFEAVSPPLFFHSAR